MWQVSEVPPNKYRIPEKIVSNTEEGPDLTVGAFFMSRKSFMLYEIIILTATKPTNKGHQ